jgi:phosphatidylglycerol:prolipoprotein diacylglycerol transferase
MNTISFPGLGIEPFIVKKVAFTVFGRDVAWYGILITLGIVAAFLYALWRCRKSGCATTDDVFDIAITAVISGIVGARLYYVIMDWSNIVVTGGAFFDNVWDTIVNSVAVWRGGLAIYGGIIFGAAGIAVCCKVKKLKIPAVFDAVAPGVQLAQAIGRWGNFTNVELYGTKTDLPWRMGILYTNGNTGYVHPLFLYESLWNLLGFALANILYKKKKFDGEIFLLYVAWYGFGRFFLEGMRVEKFSLMLGVFRVSQLVAAASFIAAVALIISGLSKAHTKKLAEGEYEPQFRVADTKGDAVVDTDSSSGMYLGSDGTVSNVSDASDGAQPGKPGPDKKPHDTVTADEIDAAFAPRENKDDGTGKSNESEGDKS